MSRADRVELICWLIGCTALIVLAHRLWGTARTLWEAS